MANEPLRPGGRPGIVATLEHDFHVPAVPSIGREEAIKRIREEAGTRALPEVVLALSDQPVARGALFDAAGVRVAFPEGGVYDRCYVALLDPSPMMRWAHPAWWAFVPVDGEGPVMLRDTKLPENPSGPVRLLPEVELTP
ncbi:MAG TPA: hypothetical protein VGB96_23410 [Archangium sp.]